ncbi:MAG: hypothetical protein BMS9Abin33_0066 [Gammaproteobacteria bacterium]|nr:MAG: hypothetical protein BMS9Abin33_0066 [Gammaproteobacteria bacterium]
MIKNGMFHYTSCGLQNVWLKNGFVVKKTSYGDAISIHNLEGLHRAIGMDLVCNKKILAGGEVRFLRKELDMSQNSFAGILGVGETTVRGWEKNRTKITGPASQLLRLLYREHVDGDGSVRGLVERIAELDRLKPQPSKHKFEDTSHGWRAVAA